MITGSSFQDMRILFRDESRAPTEITFTRKEMSEGILSLYYQGGDGAREEHCGSWPIDTIKVWHTRPTFPNDMRGKKEWPDGE